MFSLSLGLLLSNGDTRAAQMVSNARRIDHARTLSFSRDIRSGRCLFSVYHDVMAAKRRYLAWMHEIIERAWTINVPYARVVEA